MRSTGEITRHHINVARENARNNLRPQVAATIYAGFVAYWGNGARDKANMQSAIADADRLLLLLYPVVEE